MRKNIKDAFKEIMGTTPKKATHKKQKPTPRKAEDQASTHSQKDVSNKKTPLSERLRREKLLGTKGSSTRPTTHSKPRNTSDSTQHGIAFL